MVPVHIGEDRGQVLGVAAARAACDDRCVVDGARGRREAIRQLAELRRRLTAAEDALTGAHAATKQAEAAYDAANDRFAAAEGASMRPARSGPRPGGTGIGRGRHTSGQRDCRPARPASP